MRSLKFCFCVLGLVVFAPIVGSIALLNMAMRPPRPPTISEPDPIGDDLGTLIDD